MKNILKAVGLFVGMIFILLFVILIIVGCVLEVHYTLKLYKANTSEEIRAICTNIWYDTNSFTSLPVKCTQFYQQYPYEEKAR